MAFIDGKVQLFAIISFFFYLYLSSIFPFRVCVLHNFSNFAHPSIEVLLLYAVSFQKIYWHGFFGLVLYRSKSWNFRHLKALIPFFRLICIHLK